MGGDHIYIYSYIIYIYIYMSVCVCVRVQKSAHNEFGNVILKPFSPGYNHTFWVPLFLLDNKHLV